MARRRGSYVGDVQLSVDLWGLEGSAPDDVVALPAEAPGEVVGIDALLYLELVEQGGGEVI